MVFFTAFLSVLMLSSAAVLHFLLAPASQLWPLVWPFHLALYSFALFALVLVVFGRLRGRPRSESGWRFLTGAYLFSFLGLHSLLFAVLCLVLWPIRILFGIPLSQAAIWALGFAYFLGLLGLVVARLGPRLITVSLGEGKRLRILQISDLHISATLGQAYVKKVVDRAIAADADCIVLTGDIGDGAPLLHGPSIEELGRLRSPLGVFLVLGNHELYWPTSQWIDAFRAIGMQVLLDEEKVLSWQGENISLMGLGPDKRKGMAAPISHPDNLIVLAHYPDRAAEAAKAKAKLFLAGHTHGGQFWPWSWVIHFFHEYAIGLYRVENTHVYVSRGAGYWGPPLRFGRRAEITLVDIGLG